MFDIGDKVNIQKKLDLSDRYDHTHYSWRTGTIIDIDHPFLTVKYRKIYNSSDQSTDDGYEQTFDINDYHIKLISKNKKYIKNQAQKEKETQKIALSNFKQWLLENKNMTHNEFIHSQKEYKKNIEREYNGEYISEDEYNDNMYDSDNFRKKRTSKLKTKRKPIKKTKRVVLKKSRKK
jgi:hypothetical protein